MDGLALIGILLILYAVLVIVLAVKKPKSIWEMGKIKLFRRLLGEKGTVVFFYIFAAAAAGAGIWLMVK